MINLYMPEQQVDFAYFLEEIREKMLIDSLMQTVERVDLLRLDEQLHQFCDKNCLKRLASLGLRGEILFAVPCILQENPVLLGYYRLLLGYSQKAFYTSESGIGKFKSMEEKGKISSIQFEILPELCKELCKSSAYLIDGLSDFMLTKKLIDDLTLLTLGPQLRGGANVQRGTAAIKQVFNVVHNIVNNSVIDSSNHHLELKNSSGRKVLIEFAPDPDIVIREEIRDGVIRNLIAIEVKGGQDYSNIHNRIGEAEKSHQKARLSGYPECWTVVNVDRIDIDMAKKESPSTNQFFRISDLLDSNSEEYKYFRDLIIVCVGIK